MLLHTFMKELYLPILLPHSSHTQNTLYCSILGAVYPQFPTERQFRHNLESLLSSSDPNRPKHSILAHFLDDRERLAVGSALLPDLVEMYLWLDMHLAHLLPYEAARKMTLKEVITKASKRFSSEAGHIHELFERLTGKDIGATDKCTNICSNYTPHLTPPSPSPHLLLTPTLSLICSLCYRDLQ